MDATRGTRVSSPTDLPILVIHRKISSLFCKLFELISHAFFLIHVLSSPGVPLRATPTRFALRVDADIQESVVELPALASSVVSLVTILKTSETEFRSECTVSATQSEWTTQLHASCHWRAINFPGSTWGTTHNSDATAAPRSHLRLHQRWCSSQLFECYSRSASYSSLWCSSFVWLWCYALLYFIGTG